MSKRIRKFHPGFTLPYTDPSYRPYVVALGQLALAWNGLHETLGLLFCSVMGGGPVNQFLAVWHAISNDRMQRAVLMAAVQSDVRSAFPSYYVEDIQALCKLADEVENSRNNAIHSPIWAYPDGLDRVIVRPVTALGHKRAQNLADKNILAEFRWCRDSAISLAQTAYQMDVALSDYTQPWPDRPKLRNRGDGQAAKSQRQSKPPRLRRSSRA